MPTPTRIAAIKATHIERRMGWNRSRINMLCAMLQISHGELFAYLGLSSTVMKKSMRTNNLPAYACLLLEIFEAHAKRTVLGDDVNFDLPFPDKTT